MKRRKINSLRVRLKSGISGLVRAAGGRRVNYHKRLLRAA